MARNDGPNFKPTLSQFPTPALPGSEAKMQAMTDRAARGEAVFHPRDGHEETPDEENARRFHVTGECLEVFLLSYLEAGASLWMSGMADGRIIATIQRPGRPTETADWTERIMSKRKPMRRVAQHRIGGRGSKR